LCNLIALTETKTGLKVKCKLDKASYPLGIKVSGKQIKEINLVKDTFHREWNYAILPGDKL